IHHPYQPETQTDHSQNKTRHVENHRIDLNYNFEQTNRIDTQPLLAHFLTHREKHTYYDISFSLPLYTSEDALHRLNTKDWKNISRQVNIDAAPAIRTDQQTHFPQVLIRHERTRPILIVQVCQLVNRRARDIVRPTYIQ